MRIGIYGGSFNPLHNGHIMLINATLNELSLEKLIVVPCYIQPFKQDIIEDNSLDRLVMLRSVLNSPKIEVSSYEIDDKDISYTYDTLTHFRSIYPADEIVFILGTDSYLKVNEWFMGDYLLKNFSFAIAKRPGYDDKYLLEKIDEYSIKYGTKSYLLNEEMPYISSTEIRNMVKNDYDISNLVPDEISSYIKEHGLYKD